MGEAEKRLIKSAEQALAFVEGTGNKEDYHVVIPEKNMEACSVIQWRVYYGDGSTADNLSHTLADLPRWNVQIIAQHDVKHNRSLASGAAYYIYHIQDQRWYPVDFVGLLDYIVHKIGIVGAVLVGRFIDNALYDELEKHVSTDPDFLPESAGAPRFER